MLPQYKYVSCYHTISMSRVTLYEYVSCYHNMSMYHVTTI